MPLFEGLKRGRNEDDYYNESVVHQPSSSLMVIDSDNRGGFGKLNNFEQEIPQITSSSQASLVGVSSSFAFNNITEYNNNLKLFVEFDAGPGNDYEDVSGEINIDIPVGYYTMINLTDNLVDVFQQKIREFGNLLPSDEIMNPVTDTPIRPLRILYDDYNAPSYESLERNSGLIGLIMEVEKFKVNSGGSTVDMKLTFRDCTFFTYGNPLHGMSVFQPEIRNYGAPKTVLNTKTNEVIYRGPSPATMIASNYYTILSRQLTRGVKNAAIGVDGRAIGVIFIESAQQGYDQFILIDQELYLKEKAVDPGTRLNPPMPDFYRYGNMFKHQFYPTYGHFVLELDNRKGVPSVDIQIVDDKNRLASMADVSNGKIVLFFKLTNY